MDLIALAKRARLQRIRDRATDIDTVRDMLDGRYTPTAGYFAPSFPSGSARQAAWLRAIRTTSTVVPLIATKSLAALDFGNITWSDAETGAARADDEVASLPIEQFARDLATEYKLTGVMSAIAHTPQVDGRTLEPTIQVLHGVNIPYVHPVSPDRVTGWYRTLQYADDDHQGQLRWWVEAYDFDTTPVTHRVWRSLLDPSMLGNNPDAEFTSVARPRYAIAGMADDGLPISPVLANMGRVLGLYASELRLATTEELSAYPMLLTKGDADVTQVGPAEVIAVSEEGDARWLDPGKLEELREQVRLKRDQVREAFSLPAGSLGGQTPSGEALEEANRAFIQDARATSSALSEVLSDVVSDYLALLNMPPVTVDVPIDRSYTTKSLLDVLEKGTDLGYVPKAVGARMFQQFIGNAYSDEELETFLAEDEERRSISTPGFLPQREEMNESEVEGEVEPE